MGPSRGNEQAPDVVETALAQAPSKAATAGAWDAVSALTRELEARRRARARGKVVDLGEARAKRGGR